MKNLGESKKYTPVAATGARSTGQCIGGKITIDVSQGKTSENSAIIQQLDLIDADKLDKNVRAAIFRADFNSPGHGAAFNPSLNECKELVADVLFDTWFTYGNAAVSFNKQLALLVAGNSERKIYVQLYAGEALTIATASPFTLVPSYYVD